MPLWKCRSGLFSEKMLDHPNHFVVTDVSGTTWFCRSMDAGDGLNHVTDLFSEAMEDPLDEAHAAGVRGVWRTCDIRCTRAELPHALVHGPPIEAPIRVPMRFIGGPYDGNTIYSDAVDRAAVLAVGPNDPLSLMLPNFESFNAVVLRGWPPPDPSSEEFSDRLTYRMENGGDGTAIMRFEPPVPLSPAS